MNRLLLLTLFISCALAHHCDDPCYDCNEPNVYTQTYSPVILQEVSDRTILVCSDESYYDRIEYDGCYEWNTTCNGVLAGDVKDVEGIYTGVIVDKHTGNETREVLNAKYFKYIVTINNANSLTWEEAELDACECRGDTLRSISNWVSFGHRLTGCCDGGVNYLEATSYQLRIYGKCCSECYLQQASVSWQQLIKN